MRGTAAFEHILLSFLQRSNLSPSGNTTYQLWEQKSRGKFYMILSWKICFSMSVTPWADWMVAIISTSVSMSAKLMS